MVQFIWFVSRQIFFFKYKKIHVPYLLVICSNFVSKMLFKIVLDGVQLVSYPRSIFWQVLLQRLLVIACFVSKYLTFLSAFVDVSLKPPVDVRDDLIINQQTA